MNVLQSNIHYSQSAGIYCTNNSSPSIKNCVISDNLTHGIHIIDESVPTFGSNIDEWNDIHNNGGYDFYNGTSDIDLGYVYWGTITSTEIDSHIYDDLDNATLGSVNYIPWTNSTHSELYYFPAPANVTISIAAGSVQINWNAVPTATSYKVYSSDKPDTGFI